jgi:hypothetical protein
MARIVQGYAGEAINIVERVAATQELVLASTRRPPRKTPLATTREEGHVPRRADMPSPRPTSAPQPPTASSGDSGYLKLYGGDDE